MSIHIRVFVQLTFSLILWLLTVNCGNKAKLDLSQPRLTAEQFTKALIEKDMVLLKAITMNEIDIEYLCVQGGIPIATFPKTDFGKALQKLESEFTQASDVISGMANSDYKIETTDIENEDWGIEYEFYLTFGSERTEGFKLYLTKNANSDWKLMGMR